MEEPSPFYEDNIPEDDWEEEEDGSPPGLGPLLQPSFHVRTRQTARIARPQARLSLATSPVTPPPAEVMRTPELAVPNPMGR